jgi:hypothetical protein
MVSRYAEAYHPTSERESKWFVMTGIAVAIMRRSWETPSVRLSHGMKRGQTNATSKAPAIIANTVMRTFDFGGYSSTSGGPTGVGGFETGLEASSLWSLREPVDCSRSAILTTVREGNTMEANVRSGWGVESKVLPYCQHGRSEQDVIPTSFIPLIFFHDGTYCGLNLYGVQAPGGGTLRALGREIETKRGDLSERAIEKPQNLDETYKGCFRTH